MWSFSFRRNSDVFWSDWGREDVHHDWSHWELQTKRPNSQSHTTGITPPHHTQWRLLRRWIGSSFLHDVHTVELLLLHSHSLAPAQPPPHWPPSVSPSQVFREVENRGNYSFSIQLSYLEIYNETLVDLLSSVRGSKAGPGGLAVVEEAGGGVSVKGLSLHVVQNEEEALNLLFEVNHQIPRQPALQYSSLLLCYMCNVSKNEIKGLSKHLITGDVTHSSQSCQRQCIIEVGWSLL